MFLQTGSRRPGVREGFVESSEWGRSGTTRVVYENTSVSETRRCSVKGSKRPGVWAAKGRGLEQTGATFEPDGREHPRVGEFRRCQ